MSSIPSSSSDHKLPIPVESESDVSLGNSSIKEGAAVSESGEFTKSMFDICSGTVEEEVLRIASSPENEHIIPSDVNRRKMFILHITRDVTQHVINNEHVINYVGKLSELLPIVRRCAQQEVARRMLNLRIGRITATEDEEGGEKSPS